MRCTRGFALHGECRGVGPLPCLGRVTGAGGDVVGDMVAWGAHFCFFYETKQDLVDTLIAYCKSGLEREEYCLWIVAEPLTVDYARGALKAAVPDIEQYIADSRLELASARDWFLPGGSFDGRRLTR